MKSRVTNAFGIRSCSLHLYGGIRRIFIANIVCRSRSLAMREILLELKFWFPYNLRYHAALCHLRTCRIFFHPPSPGFHLVLCCPVYVYCGLLSVRDMWAVFRACLMRSQRKIIEAMTTPVKTERNITIAKDA
jgi:hypothetical protein